ncbi:hypothetical protein BJY52DRAFT_1280778, partial [Lactarius psammicola]
MLTLILRPSSSASFIFAMAALASALEENVTKGDTTGNDQCRGHALRLLQEFAQILKRLVRRLSSVVFRLRLL